MVGSYEQINLEDWIDLIGEDEVKKRLLLFKCPLNKDVENFFHKKSINFSKNHWSKTHIVFYPTSDQMLIAGYFTLTLGMPVTISTTKLSKTKIKKIDKYSIANSANPDTRLMSMPLLAQLSKNYADGCESLISGDELLQLAINTLRISQKLLGGYFLYVECEDNSKLLDFYSKNSFFLFGKRPRDEDEQIESSQLCQLMRKIPDSV